MKKRFLFSFGFIILFSLLISAQIRPNIRIAILKFKVLGSRNSSVDYGVGIQEILMTNLGQNNSIQIIERARLSDIVKELRYSGNDLFDYRKAARLGKLLQAKYIVTGSVISFGSTMRINARIIKVETSAVTKTFKVVSRDKNYIFQSLEYLSNEVEGGLLGLNQKTRSANSPKIEIAFVIDSTGSMHDEIDVVKSKINSIINKITNAVPRPIVKIGVVDYKDEDDDYITRLFNFTDDVSAVRAHLKGLQAAGGGDYPERVVDGLVKAIEGLKWSRRGASKMIFLIGDAPAHNPDKLKMVIKKANKKSISIYTIACSGLDKKGVAFFKNLAKQTNASFSYLSYRQEYIARSGERTEVITRGREVYTRRYRMNRRSGSSSGSRTPSEETSEYTRQRRNWGSDAARGGARLARRSYRRSRPGSSSIVRNRRSEGERGRVLSSESLRVRNSRPVGRMQNNLDDILINNIQRQARRDLGLRYRNLENKPIKSCALVVNSNVKIWVFFSSKEQFNKIKKYKGKYIWIAGSVIHSGNTFLLHSTIVKPGMIPFLGKKKFKSILSNMTYYENNGLTDAKRWFFKVKVLKVVKK